jgi:uncharacterized membrane protein YgcG
MSTTDAKTTAERNAAARRQFLTSCGKYAVVTAPVVALMLTHTQGAYAHAISGSRNHFDSRNSNNNNGGNGGNGGDNGRGNGFSNFGGNDSGRGDNNRGKH